MNDAHVVRDGEGGERLHENIGDARGGERPLLAEHVVQAATVEVLHGDVEEAVGLCAEVDDLHRVGVVQARRCLGLAVKAGGEHRVAGVLAVQYFDGDGLLEGDLPRAENGAHRPGAEELLDDELAGDGPPDQALVARVAHGSSDQCTWRKPRRAAPSPWLVLSLHRVEGVAAVVVGLARHVFPQLVVVLVDFGDDLRHPLFGGRDEDARQVDLPPRPFLPRPSMAWVARAMQAATA